MKKLLAGLLLVCGIAHADVTSNLITNTWNNVNTGTHPNDCCTGGPSPLYDPATNTIHFSYGLTAVHQVQAINQALSGSGVQINGWNWGYDLRNMNGVAGGQGGTDTINATSFITNRAGQIVQQSDQYYNTQFNWTRYVGTVNLNTNLPLTDAGSLGIQFVSKDNGFWAGYYGPQVRNVSLTANYTVDPCAANPRYSPSCPGYTTDMWSTGNLTSVYGTSFAVNQALGFGNSGVRVHSATWGYDYSIGGRWCSGWSLFGICLAWSDSYVGGSMNVTNSSGNQIAYDTNSTSGQNISGSFRREVLLGNTSPDISTLGNANINVWAGGVAAVSPYIGFNFTPDVCNTNPLASPQCPGYAAAYFTQQCSVNALFDPQCPGYAAAYFTQQCTINQLYSPACPGYAAAYLTYQCNINQLYSTSCPGYEQAYFTQQCSANPLYSSQCSGYSTAVTECSINPLSNSYCPNYSTAAQDCSTNGLTHSYCPSYSLETQLCSSDPLSNTLCSGYQTATTACSINPLTGSYCPNYQTATQSCSSNVLNHPYCSGYTQALNTCTTNPLSNTLCSGYSTASQQCSSNPLLYTYCPTYTTTLAACSTNSQSNTLCPGYSTTTTSSSTTTTSTASTTEATPTISSTGEVTTTVSSTGDTTVDKAITSTTTSTTSTTGTAAVTLAPTTTTTTSPTSTVAAATQTTEKKEKKDDVAQSPTKKEDNQSSTQTAQAKSDGGSSSGEKKTARQEIAEKRAEAAKMAAVKAGNEASEKMESASSMEQQVQVQNVVIQAMGFTPGFQAYNVIMPDGVGYKPFTVYKDQKTVDNNRMLRGLTGASDKLHDQLVNSQYNR